VVAKWGAATAGFRIGTGYYPRANPEECILAVRGKPPILRHDIPQMIVSPLREHSRKPDEARERIMMLTPGPYLELFARETAQGWDCWGDQAGLFDAGHVPTRRQPSTLTELGRRSP
jgi:N6-adenosine-specific RNA methylase IME4